MNGKDGDTKVLCNFILAGHELAHEGEMAILEILEKDIKIDDLNNLNVL